MSEMDEAIIASVIQRYGPSLDLEREPGVFLEILRLYRDDVQRTHAAPHEYVQVETGAVGGVSLAESLSGEKVAVDTNGEDAIVGEITNGELMRELLRLRKAVDRLEARQREA